MVTDTPLLPMGLDTNQDTVTDPHLRTTDNRTLTQDLTIGMVDTGEVVVDIIQDITHQATMITRVTTPVAIMLRVIL